MLREFILERASKDDDGFNIGKSQAMWDVCEVSLMKHFPLITSKVDRVRVLIADCPDLIDEPTLEAFWWSETSYFGLTKYHFLDIDDCEEEILDKVAHTLRRHFKENEPMYIYAEPLV